MVGIIIGYWVVRTLSLREAGSQSVGVWCLALYQSSFFVPCHWSSWKRGLGPASPILGPRKYDGQGNLLCISTRNRAENVFATPGFRTFSS